MCSIPLLLRISVLALAAALPAQTSAVVVAAEVPGTPAAILYEIDLGSGALTVLPRFASDSAAPVAVTIDPIDGSLLVGLDVGNRTRIVRLRRGPGGFSEQVLGAVNGTATQLLVDRLGNVVATVGGASGGVFRLPRHGGLASTIRREPRVTAAFSPNGLAWTALIGLSGQAGPPVIDPGIGLLDLENGQFVTPRTVFNGFTPRVVTGILDLPTALPRQVMAHGDGSLSLFVQQVAALPMPVATTPALPAGGAETMKWSGTGNAVLLGDSRSPLLYTFDPLAAVSGTAVLTRVVTPLIGDPADLALVPPFGAETLRFAPACGNAAELFVRGTGGLPQLGNASFAVELSQGLPQQPALLALGTDELQGVPLPNGCAVRVLPAAVAFHLTDANGEATQPLPVPNVTSLVGLLLLGQWFQDDNGVPFVTSQVVGIRVGT